MNDDRDDEFKFHIPDYGQLILNANLMRPSLVEAMIKEYDEMLLDTIDLDPNDDSIPEIQKTLERLYEIRGLLNRQ